MESRVREAVAAGEFERAQELWNTYMVQVQEEVRQGSLSGAQIEEVRRLMEWCRGVALSARQHAQDRLNSLLVAAEYESAAPSPERRIIQVSL
jgi:hypothetical protein